MNTIEEVQDELVSSMEYLVFSKGTKPTEIQTYNKLYADYLKYCKHDGKKLYHLPFIIWLKHVAKIKLDD